MVNAKLPIPLHTQISLQLEKCIQKGLYEDKIPSERELMEMFSVSRTTIREAISRLVNEGKLEKIHGKGTFISVQPPVQEWLSSLNSLTDTINSMGMRASSKLLFSGRIQGIRTDNNVFEKEKELFLIKRIRYADYIPFAIENHYYPLEIGVQLNKFDLNTATIYDLIEKELNINLWEAEQSISSETARDNDAGYLDIPINSNVLSAERITYDIFGNTVELYSALYRPDMYVFRIKTKRKSL